MELICPGIYDVEVGLVLALLGPAVTTQLHLQRKTTKGEYRRLGPQNGRQGVEKSPY